MLDTVTCWLQAAGREPRLTDEELIILSRTIQSSSSGKASKRAGQRALDRVIRANLRLIVTVMRKRFSWISLRGPSLPIASRKAASACVAPPSNTSTRRAIASPPTPPSGSPRRSANICAIAIA